MMANSLIDHMANSHDWQEVDLKETAELARQGFLVVGGLKGEAHGHVIIVYPGEEKPRGGYYFRKPNMAKDRLVAEKGMFPRAMSTSMGNFPGAKSNGDKTVWDPWGSNTKFESVRFWRYTGHEQVLSSGSVSNGRWRVSETNRTKGPIRDNAVDNTNNSTASRRWRLEADSPWSGKPEHIVRWQK
jgi:hypothetical protein